MLFSLAGQKPGFLLFSAMKPGVFKALRHHLLTQTSTKKHWKTLTLKDSKSSCPQGHVGSNPTASAKNPAEIKCFSGAFYV